MQVGPNIKGALCVP